MSAPIPTPVHASILDRLRAVEAADGVRIVYACESGSRAWGFPSADSDFDVRFLYVRPPDWYFSIDVERRRDVIERPIDDALDLGGWDLRKALGLLRKSNPPLLEWLDSPIVYRQDAAVVPDLRALAAACFQPRAAYHHYLNMARRTARAYLTGERVNHKKYFYALRPLLAVRWIEADLGPVPTAFDALVEAVAPPGPFRAAVAALLAEKRAGSEADAGPPVAPLQAFVEGEIARHEAAAPSLPDASVSLERLNAYFRATIRRVWA